MTDLHKSECYCTNLRRSANAVSSFYDAKLKEAGITVSQYFLLVNLQRLEKANITHWAEFVRLDRSTMVRNIKVLLSHNLIEQTVGSGKTFQLSETGEQALAYAIPLWEAAQKEIEEHLGEEDSKAILRLESKLMDFQQ